MTTLMQICNEVHRAQALNPGKTLRIYMREDFYQSIARQLYESSPGGHRKEICGFPVYTVADDRHPPYLIMIEAVKR